MNYEFLNNLYKEIDLELIPKNKKVLFTHSFSIYEPCFVHDRLMAYSLMFKGFDIYATFCDGIQDLECNVYGGVWGGGEKFKKNCENCKKKSKDLWGFLDENHICMYSKYLTQKEYDEVNTIIDELTYDSWKDYSEDENLFGPWAKDILVNNYVVGDYKLIENYEILGKNHLKNLILSYRAARRIIKEVNPDRIISNDSYYGMWKMWELLAKRNNIPFYSHWSGTRFGGWCYAYNNPSMALDFSASWNNYSLVDLSDEEEAKVDQWLKDRQKGKDMIVDTASLSTFKNETFDMLKIDKSKPTALLSANVIWDLAALNKEIFTHSMSEWILETIKWFTAHPKFQLIIKAHPAEYYPDIPQTKETLELIIRKEFESLPENIIFISPKASILVYDLFSMCKVGLVFTTSVGMEMVAHGIPVITAGLSHYRGYGFTIDPSTKDEYFDNLLNCLNNKNIINYKLLAKKFIKFNFFHYFSKIGLFEFEWQKPVKINITSFKDLKEENFPNWDYIINKISHGLPILDENNWPEES